MVLRLKTKTSKVSRKNTRTTKNKVRHNAHSKRIKRGGGALNDKTTFQTLVNHIKYIKDNYYAQNETHVKNRSKQLIDYYINEHPSVNEQDLINEIIEQDSELKNVVKPSGLKRTVAFKKSTPKEEKPEEENSDANLEEENYEF